MILPNKKYEKIQEIINTGVGLIVFILVVLLLFEDKTKNNEVLFWISNIAILIYLLLSIIFSFITGRVFFRYGIKYHVQYQKVGFCLVIGFYSLIFMLLFIYMFMIIYCI